MSAVLSPAPQQELGHQVMTWTELAKQLSVTDQTTFQQGGRYLLAIKELQTQADETFDPIIRKAHEAHKEAIGQKKRICDPLVEAASVSTWNASARNRKKKAADSGQKPSAWLLKTGKQRSKKPKRQAPPRKKWLCSLRLRCKWLRSCVPRRPKWPESVSGSCGAERSRTCMRSSGSLRTTGST
jgi:hypothetical protein